MYTQTTNASITTNARVTTNTCITTNVHAHNKCTRITNARTQHTHASQHTQAHNKLMYTHRTNARILHSDNKKVQVIMHYFFVFF